MTIVTPTSLYKAGTISLVEGSATVVGVGTFWTAVAVPGDRITVDGQTLVIDTVTADAAIELAQPWTGTSVSGRLYVLTYDSWLRYEGAALQGGVRDLIAFYKMGGVRGTREVVLATDAISVNDLNRPIVYNRPTAIAVTLPKAGANSQFVDGWATILTNQNNGIATIAPVGCTINGASSIAIVKGAALYIWSHNGNYRAILYSTLGEQGPQGERGIIGPVGDTGVPGLDGKSYGGTSATSLLIGAGTKALATQAGLAYQVGARVRVSSAASPANYMEGLVTGYSGSSLTLDASRIGGAGTFANWSINVIGEPGATGSGTGDLLSSNNLSDVPDKAAARTNLGGTTVGKALFTAADTAAAQTAIGASTIGKALLAATDAVAARTAIGVSAHNLIINGDFRINQRGYISGTARAAGVYCHDRWRAGAGAGDYVFTQLAGSTQITMTAGKSLIQVVEDRNVEGGAYTLSWSGTATARIGVNSATPSGNFAVSPITISGQNPGAAMSVEFTGANAAGGSALATNIGTLGKVKLEVGSAPTPFVMSDFSAELVRCFRYFQKIGFGIFTAPADGVSTAQHQGSTVNANGIAATIRLFAPMRAIPSVAFYRGASGTANGTWAFWNGLAWVNGTGTAINSSDETQVNILVSVPSGPTVAQAYSVQGAATLSAEL